MGFYSDNALLHPIRTIRRAVRRWTLRADLDATHPGTGDFDAGEIPEALKAFSKGEYLPWKGVHFRVGKVVGGPFPAVILVPQGVTRGKALGTLRDFRAAGNARLDAEKSARSAANREYRRVQ